MCSMFIFGSNSLKSVGTALEYVGCGNADGIPKPVPQLTTIAYTLLVVGVPLILITFSIITLVKANASGNADDILKARLKLMKKVIIAGLVFLVAAIVQLVIFRVAANDEDQSTMNECLKCFLFYNSKNCYASTSGNSVNTDTKHKTHSSYAEPTVSNRQPTHRTNSNSGNSGYTPAGQTIFIGDSRTVGMCQQSTSSVYVGSCRSETAVCKSGAGYTWFRDTAISKTSELLQNDSNNAYNIVILMGVNDVGSSPTTAVSAAKNYVDKISELANSDWKNHNIIYASITPLGAATAGNASQTSVNKFNSTIKSYISQAGLSNFHYCDVTGINLENKFSGDNLHYTADGYTTMYNYIKSQCL